MQYRAVILILLLVLSCYFDEAGYCKTIEMKKHCDDCHTMHDSIDGNPMVTGGIGTQPTLLKSNCYGCHRGQNYDGSMPFVMSTGVGAPDYGTTGTSAAGVVNGTLAGGSFYWVSQGQDNMGHNVDVLTSQFSRTAPGSNPPLTFDADNPLTCAGPNGCHGNRSASSENPSMYRTHHSPDAQDVDGSTLAQSYRFLNGVSGVEDINYEFTVSANDHNQYKGFIRSTNTATDTSSMSQLCAGCHGDFHAAIGDPWFPSPWLRHPVDFDMNLVVGGEYGGYGGAGNPYMAETPLASDISPSDITNKIVQSNVLQSPGDAIISCITCHRAHGSPYNSSLRWDYRSWPGGGYNGCGDCHTARD